MRAVVSSHPEVIVHQMTALASMRSLKHFDDEFAVTNRLRIEGTRHLLESAHACGAHKFVAQSYTGWPNERRGSRVKTEEDPLDSDPPKAMTKTLSAIRALECLVKVPVGFGGALIRWLWLSLVCCEDGKVLSVALTHAPAELRLMLVEQP